MGHHRTSVPRGLAHGAALAALLALTASGAPPAGPIPTSADAERARRLLIDGDYAAAESTARVVVSAARAAPGADSLEYARALDLLVLPLARNGKAKRAETRALAETAIRIKERALPQDSAGLAASLNNLGEVVFQAGSSAAARPLFRRALEIRTRVLGEQDTLTAFSLASLARPVADSNLAAGRALAERALEIRRTRLGPDHRDVGRSLAAVGWYERMVGDWDAAKEHFEQALKIQERVLPPWHPDLASTLQQYGWLTNLMSDTQRGVEMDRRALAIREHSLSPRHPDLGHILNDIGWLETVLGDYRQAHEHLGRALEIFDDYMGADALQPTKTRANLARVAFRTGDFAESRRLFEQALAAMDRLGQPDPAETAAILTSYAQLLFWAGDYSGAQERLERALGTLEKAGRGQRKRLLASRLILAQVLAAKGDLPRADSLYVVAVGPRTTAGDSLFENVVPALATWSELCMRLGAYPDARLLARKAVAIAEADSAYPEHIAGASEQLAIVEAALGHVVEAESLYARVERLMPRAVGPNHPELGYMLANHAELLARWGRPGALDRALEAERIGREHVILTMETLSERQALGYAGARPTAMDAMLTLAGSAPDARARVAVFDAVIRGRSLVLDEIASRHRSVASIESRARAFADASEQLANLTVRGPGSEEPGEYRASLERAQAERDRAEHALSESNASFRMRQSDRQRGAREVAGALPDQSALVAFVAYDRLAGIRPARTGPSPTPLDSVFAQVPSYLAFVLRSGESAPDVVPIGARAVVDSLVSRWGEAAASDSPGRAGEAAYLRAGRALRRAIWDPVAPHLGGAERVFLVLDGATLLVNFATLPLDSGAYLVEQGPLLHTLNSERDLLRNPALEPTGAGLLALGGPDFDHPPAPASTPPRPQAVVAAATFRGGLSRCGEFQALRWTALPAAAREAREIEALWNASANTAEPATTHRVLLGTAASEAAFKRFASGRRILHLATHGFVLKGSCSAPATHGSNLTSDSEDRRRAISSAESPLLLSGFALAGANLRARAASGTDDGVLTAEEVSSLDLSSVEWAVLSACETGAGEVRAGEGVFGLRRAFQIAGARTLVMSLWAVDDEDARRWMGELYRGRLVRRLGTAEAVRSASLAILRERRARGETTHPFHWGAFVAAGDWR